jgi:ABC-type sugar transport system permease subunit
MNKKTKAGYIFLLPSLVLAVVLILYPVLKTVYISFFDYKIQTMAFGAKFIGLSNYFKILRDEQFYKALYWTIEFTVISVVLELIIGMALALIMNRKIFGKGLIRTTVLIPWAIPTIVAGLMWAYLFNYNGLVNGALGSLGFISENIPWLTKGLSAKTAIIIADVWKTTPYMSLLLLAGLQNISKSVYEAGDIDGASKYQQFLHITLPLLKPAIMVALLFRVVAAFRIYDLIVATTSGGPSGLTESLSIYAVDTYFTYGNVGYGAALAVSMLIVSLFISFLFINTIKTKVR